MQLPNRRVLGSALLAVMGSHFRFGFSMALVNPLMLVLEPLMIRSFHAHYGIDLGSEQLADWRYVLTGLISGWVRAEGGEQLGRFLALGSLLGALAFGCVNRLCGRRSMLMLMQVRSRPEPCPFSVVRHCHDLPFDLKTMPNAPVIFRCCSCSPTCSPCWPTTTCSSCSSFRSCWPAW